MEFFTWIFASLVFWRRQLDQRNIFLKLARKILKPLLLIQFIPRHRSSDIPAVDSLDNFHYIQHSPYLHSQNCIYTMLYRIYTFFLSSNMTGVYGRKYVRDRDNPIICSLHVHVTFSGLLETLSLATLPILITSSQVSGIKMTPSLSTIWKQ